MEMARLLIFLSMLGFANLSAETSPSIFDVLGYKEVVKVEIETDLTSITTDRRNEEKQAARFTYENAAGEQEQWNIKLKLRGKLRRKICSPIPPLKLYFDKDDLKAAGLAKYDDLKLVNYCGDNKEEAKELLIKEYLAYKMYNELTDQSFRVQLLKITYRDTETNHKIKQWGFLIEDTAQLRARIGAKKYDVAVEKGGEIPLARRQAQLVAVFEYMIGNTDWRTDFEKNVKFMSYKDQVLAIPYDFDYSGLVDPPYATPDVNYGLTSLQERAYLGTVEDIDSIRPILAYFKKQKEAIVNVVLNERHLFSDAKDEMLAYIESFYADLSQETLLSDVRTISYTQYEPNND